MSHAQLRNVRHAFRLLAVSLLFTSVAACDSASPTSEAGEEQARGGLGKADLAGTCVAEEGGDYCGGKSAGACWCDDLCVSYGDCCEDVEAVCNPPEPEVCGGFLGLQCDDGFECIDDPDDACDPQSGGADCSGICVEEEQPQFCGGIAGLQCPDGFECVDNPGDGCDPQNGGADCGGICVEDLGCTPAECGPAPGAPNFLCDDGVTVGGPSDCQELDDGSCGYVFVECPDDGPSCEGSCGGQSEDGCWCDEYCAYYGDCCDDYAPVCEGTPCGDDSCGADEVCVTMVTQLGPQFSCEPVSADCEDDATCGCMGEDVCTGVFNACSDNEDGGISCGCPVC